VYSERRIPNEFAVRLYWGVKGPLNVIRPDSCVSGWRWGSLSASKEYNTRGQARADSEVVTKTGLKTNQNSQISDTKRSMTLMAEDRSDHVSPRPNIGHLPAPKPAAEMHT
jgi:hypothetical protein